MPLSPAQARPEAEALVIKLQSHAEKIAALIAPPFSPARRRKIEVAFSEAAYDFNSLSRLVVETRPQVAIQDTQMYSFFNGMSDQLALWNEARVIMRLVKPVTAPKTNPETQPLLLAYEKSFGTLHDHFLRQASTLRPADWPHPFHRDIALPFTRFLIYAALARRVARAIGKTEPLHFVDVGCGVGLKLLQAASLYEQVSGIEYEPHRAKAAAYWLGKTAQVITADALTFEGYADFDVIYAYKPLQDDNMMRETEDRIVSQAKAGTILIMPYMDFHNRHEELGCIQIKDAVYVAKATPKAIARAMALLPHIGEALPAENRRPDGFAAPIRTAMRHWGHLP